MAVYEGFAGIYDRAMDNIPYHEWCEEICDYLRENGITKGTICDLGCGTGVMTELLRQKGYDIVFGRRAERQDSFFKRFGSLAFNKVLDYFTDSKHDNSIANFGIYSRKVVETINRYREHSRDFLLFAQMVGFKKIEIDIEHAQRAYKHSSYNLSKLFRLAIDSIVSHSNKPLRLSIQLGFFLALASLIHASWLIARYFLYGTTTEGWTSLMVSMFFMFGLLFGIIGITGLYIGKIFDEVKRRPLYIVQETINL